MSKSGNNDRDGRRRFESFVRFRDKSVIPIRNQSRCSNPLQPRPAPYPQRDGANQSRFDDLPNSRQRFFDRDASHLTRFDFLDATVNLNSPRLINVRFHAPVTRQQYPVNQLSHHVCRKVARFFNYFLPSVNGMTTQHTTIPLSIQPATPSNTPKSTAAKHRSVAFGHAEKRDALVFPKRFPQQR